MKWWDKYSFVSDSQYLSNFTEEEFTSRIPYDIQLGVSKITIAESVEWSKYFDKHGVWPSVSMWNTARKEKVFKLSGFELLFFMGNEGHY